MDYGEIFSKLEPLSVEQQQAIAMRSALRVLPLAFDTAHWAEDLAVPKLALASFRCIFISWVARKYPTHDMSEYALSALSAADSARSAALSAADSARSAALSARSALSALSARSARSARSAALSAADSAALSARSAVAWDLETGRTNSNVSVLLTAPLFSGDDGNSNYFLDTMNDALSFLEGLDGDAGGNWPLIAYWWRSLRDSTSNELFSEDRAVELTKQPDSFWGDKDDSTPDEIIARVAKVLGWPFEDENTLAQGPAAYTFEEQDGKIIAQPLVAKPSNERLASALHAELVAKLERLRERLEQTQASRHLLGNVDRLLSALGENLSEADEHRLFSIKDGLDSDALTYSKEGALEEHYPDVISMILEVQQSTSGFISCFPELSALQTEIITNKLKTIDLEQFFAAADDISEFAAESPLVDPSAVEALSENKPIREGLQEQHAFEVDQKRAAENLEIQARFAASELLLRANFVRRTAATAGDVLEAIGRGSISLTQAEITELKKLLDGNQKAAIRGSLKLAAFYLLNGIMGPASVLVLFHASLGSALAIINKILDQIKKLEEK